MLPHKPEEWPGLFERLLGSGDLESVVALYDPDATFVPRSGQPVRGRDAIRPILAGLIDRKAQLRPRVIKVVVAGDTALLYTDWDATGQGSEEHSRAVEVLRRQADGTWLLVVGDPNGRG